MAKARLICIIWLFFWMPLQVSSQTDTVQLEDAEVVGLASPNTYYQVIPQINSHFRATQPPLLLSTGNLLNLAPGVAVFQGTEGTAKFSFRGMGARTQYSTSRSLLYLGQIPLTSIQGFSSFEDLNPQWVQPFGINNGQGKSYPLALGATVHYDLAPSLLSWQGHDGLQISSQYNFGSFGFSQSNTWASYHSEKMEVLAGYENTYRDGWRENSELKRQSLFMRSRWWFDTDYLEILVYGIQNRSAIPSSLALSDFKQNPEQAAESWGRTAGYKEYDRLITGITYSHNWDKILSYDLTLFYRYLDNFEPRPFNILQETRHSGGIRFQLESVSFELFKAKSQVFSFGEYQLGNEDAATFENIFDSLQNTYNHPGRQLNVNEITGQRFNAGVSLQSSFRKNPADSSFFTSMFGLNGLYQYNRVLVNEDLDYAVPFIPAPILAVRYQHLQKNKISPFLKFYRSFSIPSLEENLDPDGSLNRNLEPELAWTAEAGFNLGNPISQYQMQVNYYYTQVQNLIVPRVIGPDQVVATNSGRSEHTGVELNLNYTTDFLKYGWQPSFTLSGYYGSFKYLNFSDTAGSFSGNELPGFPEWQVNASAEVHYKGNSQFLNSRMEDKSIPAFQFTWGIMGQYTAGYFVNDENTVTTEPYFLLQSWIRSRHRLGNRFLLELSAGLQNITNTRYAAMTVVNNQSFGQAPPRYYYPGQPLNWFGGVNLSYKIF